MDKWAKSNSTQDSQKGCTKLLSLPDNSIFMHPLQGFTLSFTTSSTHKKPSENFTYAFVLGPLQFQSTGQITHLTSKTADWLR